MDKKDAIFLATAFLLPHFSQTGSSHNESEITAEFKQLYRILKAIHANVGRFSEDEHYIDPDRTFSE